MVRKRHSIGFFLVVGMYSVGKKFCNEKTYVRGYYLFRNESKNLSRSVKFRVTFLASCIFSFAKM